MLVPDENPQVCKSNALIEASYRLTLNEQRIILACIAQVNRSQPITDEIMYSVTTKSVADVTGAIWSNSLYKELADAALKLKRREVWIKEKPNGAGSRGTTLVTGWVQSIAYHKDEGRIELRFSKDMLPYLAELSSHFTRYSLSEVAQMSSPYAIRLYELLIQRRELGERKMGVDWLRNALLLESKYESIKDFRKWVIQPAVEQINTYSSLKVDFKPIKTGRKITHFLFFIEDKKPRKKRLKND